ncbi:type IV toxin-antitoxin system AbiEi family antitoxin [Pontibacter sp. E15-1]|uniref:type IV toxin-antitoxin system AbiEi family antitoxin n=1 Tax=Pontibacter sp. E15-1 TaxID=2919918 RepID=UPI001F4F7751|nr:type IV toxin-antitoxin system AbiEi family antitoxin [Pontibacter sp. E15-1]MCJ8165786.1 type IV toxin-antitoxin system AbiEi family antitoxin [Pontibacter sp. E15-1]
MDENETVDLAIENLEKNTPFQGTWTQDKVGNDLDGEITLKFNTAILHLPVTVKKVVRAPHLHHIERLAKKHNDLLLIAYVIDEKAKAQLRALDIAYLEGNGNLYLRKDKLFFWLDNNKPLKPEKEKTNRAFTRTGLKVVFHFLQSEEALNLPYRIIAALTDTALGNVPNVLNGLKAQGFLLHLNDRELKLQNKRELLERWMTAYQQDLKPSLEIGTFRFLKQEDFDNWQTLALKPAKTWWGSEPAADLYTNYLKPEILTLYTVESRSQLIKNYRLIPDPKGNVRVYQRFWKQDGVNGKTVPPLLIYADLMNTGDRRCIAAAEKLYNEFLQDKL